MLNNRLAAEVAQAAVLAGGTAAVPAAPHG